MAAFPENQGFTISSGNCHRPIERFDLPGIDLDLQPNRHAAGVLGLDPEAELRRDRALIELRPPQPRLQDNTQPIEDRPDRTGRRAHQVDILRVAQRRREVQLVERRSTANSQRVAQHVVREDLDQSTADDEVLLDLSLVGPGNDIAPGYDVLRRDHASTWGTRRTMMRHRRSRRRGSGAMSESRASCRSSSDQGSDPRARSASSIGSASASWPRCSSR